MHETKSKMYAWNCVGILVLCPGITLALATPLMTTVSSSLPITLALIVFCGGLSKYGMVNTSSQPCDSFTLKEINSNVYGIAHNHAYTYTHTHTFMCTHTVLCI